MELNLRPLCQSLICLLFLSTYSFGEDLLKVEMEVNKSGYSTLKILISGEITPKLSQRVLQAIDSETTFLHQGKKLKADISEVRLGIMSGGGDLNEAMQLGRLARSMNMLVTPIIHCESSCVFVLAGGVKRQVIPMPLPGQTKSVKPKISIHRPYFENGPSSANAGELLVKTLSESKAYLQEMNIPPELADRMFSIESHQSYSLSNDELSFYRLNQDDFAYRENKDLEMIKSLGTSRQKYMRFQKELNESCSKLPPLKMNRCVDEIAKKWGFL